MKRILSFWTMAVSIIAVIVFTAIPHHHHKEVVCMMMERCSQDGSYNDEHTGHTTDDREETCPEAANLTTILSSISQTDSTSDGFLPLFISILHFLVDIWQDLEDNSSLPVHTVYRVSYTSAVLGDTSGLRAPPYLLKSSELF